MIKLIKSTFYKEAETKGRLVRFIQSARQLSFGEECKKFERGFARYQGRKHCVFVNSVSSANLTLIQALLNLGMIKRGDRVGFSAITWSTNIMPLLQLGLKVAPIDIELDTLNISSRTLEKSLGNFGIASTYSFYVGHHMSTIEGGVVCTDNKELAQMLKLVRAHGWDR